MVLLLLFHFYSVFQFSKASGNQVDECKLKVTYVPPPQPPSPVREGSEEGSSPRASVSDNGTTLNQASDFNNVSKGCLLCIQHAPFSILFRNSMIILLLYYCRCLKGLLSNRRSHQRLYPNLQQSILNGYFVHIFILFWMELVWPMFFVGLFIKLLKI